MIEKIAQMRDGLRVFFTRLEAAVDDVAAKVSPVVATVTDKVEHGVLAAEAWLRRLPTTLSDLQLKVVEQWEGSQTRAALANFKRVFTHPEEIDWEGVKNHSLMILSNPINQIDWVEVEQNIKSYFSNPVNQAFWITTLIGGGIFGMSAFLKDGVRFFPRCQITSGVYNTSALENIIQQGLKAEFNQRDVITEISQDLQENRLRTMPLEDIIRFVILNDLYRVSLQKKGKLMRIFSFGMKSLYFDINLTNSTFNSWHHQELVALGLGALWGSTTSVQFYAIPEEEMKLIQYAHSEFLAVNDTDTGEQNSINVEDFHLAFLNYITGICVFANDLDVSNLIRELKNMYLLNINTSKYNFYRFMGNYQCFGITDDAGYYIKLDAGNINNIVDLPYYSAKKRLFIDTNILISLLKYDLQTKLLALNSQGGLLRDDPIFTENQYSQSDEDVALFMQNLNTGAHSVEFLITDMIFDEFITTSSRLLTKIITENNDPIKQNKHGRLNSTDEALIQTYIQKLTALRQSFAPILSHTEKFITWRVS